MTSVQRTASKRARLDSCTLAFVVASFTLLLMGVARGDEVREIFAGGTREVSDLHVCEDETIILHVALTFQEHGAQAGLDELRTHSRVYSNSNPPTPRCDSISGYVLYGEPLTELLLVNKEGEETPTVIVPVILLDRYGAPRRHADGHARAYWALAYWSKIASPPEA